MQGPEDEDKYVANFREGECIEVNKATVGKKRGQEEASQTVSQIFPRHPDRIE